MMTSKDERKPWQISYKLSKAFLQKTLYKTGIKLLTYFFNGVLVCISLDVVLMKSRSSIKESFYCKNRIFFYKVRESKYFLPIFFAPRLFIFNITMPKKNPNAI